MDKIALAGCIITDDYNRILLIHRSSVDISHWELPGGKVEKPETAEAAAVREIKEELGVSVRLVAALGSGDFEIEDREYRYNWFRAVIESGEPKICEPNTFDDMDYFDVEDLLSLSLSPNMKVLLDKMFSGEVSL